MRRHEYVRDVPKWSRRLRDPDDAPVLACTAWTKKNENAMQKDGPPGWAYRGTHAAVLGFGKHDVATIWECSKYGDFDTLREYREETWDRLNQEAVNFFLPGSGEAILLRDLSDTKIMEPKGEAKKPK